MDLSALRWGIAAGSCKHGNKLSGSVKRGEFLDKLSDY